ncbi:MAG: Restriction endonuclease [Chloroflexota bacterium]|nr:Restriction endonuclease [Chloroflexota bacterium]
MIDQLGSNTALQLALTAGAGDLATATLITARRRRRQGGAGTSQVSVASQVLAAQSWQELVVVLVAAFTRLGYEVEEVEEVEGGVVDLILSDAGGYIYVSGRHWREPHATSKDLARLKDAMDTISIKRGLWLCSGIFTPPARIYAEKTGIELVGPEKLASMLEEVTSPN